ncbi:MAG: YbjQ family protein [candidate division Zixibacteria bacterium]|nr:YbjQ family protein [candidate division Zixibacteria bacterium]
MIVTSCENIIGKKIVKTVGLVKGNTVRARHIGRDIGAALRGIVGGEISEYTKLIAESREQSIDRMIAQAEAVGANAIIMVRFSTSEIMKGAAELLAYGTAVIIENDQG